MAKGTFIALAGTLVAALVTAGLLAPAAVAASPKCTPGKANKYVACTDKLRANTAPRKKSARPLPVLMVIPNRDWGGSSASTRRLAK